MTTMLEALKTGLTTVGFLALLTFVVWYVCTKVGYDGENRNRKWRS